MKHIKTFEGYSSTEIIDEGKIGDFIGSSDKARSLLWLIKNRSNQTLVDKMKDEFSDAFLDAMTLYKKWYKNGKEIPINKDQKQEKENDINKIVELINPLRKEYEKNIGLMGHTGKSFK